MTTPGLKYPNLALTAEASVAVLGLTKNMGDIKEAEICNLIRHYAHGSKRVRNEQCQRDFQNSNQLFFPVGLADNLPQIRFYADDLTPDVSMMSPEHAGYAIILRPELKHALSTVDVFELMYCKDEHSKSATWGLYKLQESINNSSVELPYWDNFIASSIALTVVVNQCGDHPKPGEVTRLVQKVMKSETLSSYPLVYFFPVSKTLGDFKVDHGHNSMVPYNFLAPKQAKRVYLPTIDPIREQFLRDFLKSEIFQLRIKSQNSGGGPHDCASTNVVQVNDNEMGHDVY